MAYHQFGIMQDSPKPHTRYDTFEPENYNCISADDEYIEPLLGKVSKIACFSHIIDIPHNGLVYCGITLIPPESLPQFIEVFSEVEMLNDIVNIMCDAFKQKKFVIHYGI